MTSGAGWKRCFRFHADGHARRPYANEALRQGNDWYVFTFTATEFSGELIDSPEGKLEWIPDEEILDLNLWASDHI
ncbi:MAG TPA: hypothetical protein VKB04_00620, partial [Anaerolineales bacterium]|nr:hypothetical protein [Anaerolineales bacterium]